MDITFYQDIQPKFTETQLTWMKYEKAGVFILGILLFLMSINNVYYYLLKDGKYKVLANSLLYVVAVLTIVLTLYYAYLIPFGRCRVDYIISIYMASCFNLILGIIQASVLTILCQQLRSLFIFTSVLKADRRESEASQEEQEHSKEIQVSKQGRREKFVNAVMISLSGLLVVLYVIYLSYYINLRITEDLCDIEKQNKNKQFIIAWNVYDGVQLTFEMCVAVWLIAASYYTIQVLRNNIDENFKREKYRIYIILATYTFLYFVQFCYHAIMLASSSNPTYFFRDEWDLVG